MSIRENAEVIRALSNPEGINQYTKGEGLHKAAADAHKAAALAYSSIGAFPGTEKLKERSEAARAASKKASALSQAAHGDGSESKHSSAALQHGLRGEHYRAVIEHTKAAKDHMSRVPWFLRK